MKHRLIALAIAASAVLAPLSVAPVAQAVPCRAIPSPWCNSSEQTDNPMKPREVKQGKKSPRSAGNPSAR